MGFVCSVGLAAMALWRGVKGPGPSNLHWAAQPAGAQQVGKWTTTLGHHVEKSGVFWYSLVACTLLQSRVGFAMGGILNNHELGLYILWNHELWGLCLRQGPSTSQHCLWSQTYSPQPGELCSPPFHLPAELLTQLTNCFSLCRNLLLFICSWTLSE